MTSCPSYWVLWNNHCYYLSYYDYGTWDKAKAVCEKLAADAGIEATLGTIDSEEEQQFIWKQINASSVVSWIGLHQEQGNQFVV